MTHHVFFLLLLCVLLFSLARLCFLGWFYHGPAQLAAAKRTSLHRLRHRPARQTIAPSVVTPPRPPRVQGQRLLRCVPGAR
jgi:hypothetical protein